MPSLRIEDQDLYYDWTRANDDGLTLVFIHGLGSSSSFFAPIIPTLVKHGCSCLAFDTPGSALSKYRGRDCDSEMICGAASALITALDLDSKRIIVVGHSMGAIFASELALHLDLVGVVLIGPVSPSDALGQLFAARIKRVEAEGMEAMASTIPTAATGPKATSTHRAFIRALLLAQSPQGYMSLCRTIASAKCPRYGDIRCPLLIIAGSHDLTSPPQDSREILQSWGGEQRQKRVEVLEGVGHWHCIEAADEVCELVKIFADSLSREF
ncbi:alpha/beta hydrolase family protein [Hirsutella rhossiliensis]|uniref:Alpha/beta hydrolase family domain-containing protein n=1 Tax=Hirsutella rhossiliensis TaxID=111463 RepID=A0A9P8MNI0_9HYPO|nr:alpha/beta hydrolase family domain-containing protein [Hirsutella rhossiliensis]KAH0958320.1 alpha/beta hydrolase family domain-containing protein [Hirsutella rhossiliensis]